MNSMKWRSFPMPVKAYQRAHGSLAVIILLGTLCVSLAASRAAHAQCTPTSAQLWISGDDITSVWINGEYIGSTSFCGPTCTVTPLAVPVSVFSPGQDVTLAVETENNNP